MIALNPAFLLLMAAALCAITALVHSIAGEQRLIGPLLASDNGALADPLAHPLARQVARFAWHWTSVLWLLVGGFLALSAYGHIESYGLLLAVGISHVAMGIADAFLTRGQHIGWPLITIIGVLTLLAIYTTQ